VSNCSDGVGAARLEAFCERAVVREPASVRRHEHASDAPRVRAAQDVVDEVEEQRVQRRLAARQEDRRQLAFLRDQAVDALAEVLLGDRSNPAGCGRCRSDR
jgi:hypothetical protein